MNTVPVVVWGDKENLLQDLERSVASVVVVRQCEDLAEVLGVIGAGLASHVVLAGPTPEITAAFAEGLSRAGGRGVCLVPDDADRPRLTRLGLRVLGWDADASAVAAELLAVTGGQGDSGGQAAQTGQAGHGRHGSPVPPGSIPPGSAPPKGAWAPRRNPEPSDMDSVLSAHADSAPAPPLEPAIEPEHSATLTQAHTPGRITVVWGTHGAPGRSTVALNLAVETALKGSRVALVDADTHAASLSPMLGLMDETAGLVRLTRAVAQADFDPVEDTAAHARVRVGDATLRFTSGLPRPNRWAEVSGTGLRAALTALAATCDHVVVDVAAPVGQDDDLAIDTFAPQRNDATVAALALADTVLVIGTADPVGLPRLIRACEELPERTERSEQPGDPGPDISIVVNKLRASSSGPRPEASLLSAWRRFGPRDLVPAHFLSWDQAAADAALLAGRALSEVAPRSGLRRAIGELAPTAVASRVVGQDPGTEGGPNRAGRTRQRRREARRGASD